MGDIFIDVDIALTELPVNKVPLVAKSDGTTINAAVAYNAAGMDLNWNFITSAGSYTQTNVVPTTAGTHDWVAAGNGMYTIEVPASAGTINNDTEGYGWFSGETTAEATWVSPIYCFRAAGINDLLCDSAYSVTRGLSGTALPAAVADAAGGLAISDAGGLDLDGMNTHLTDMKGAAFAGATDSLEAIRDRGDAAWITGTGSSPANILQTGTITVTSQTVFVLSAGSGDDDAYNNQMIIITDQTTGVQKSIGLIADTGGYVGASRTVTLNVDPGIFTISTGDIFDIVAISGSAVALEVDASGRVDVGAVSGTTQTPNDNGADINTLLSRIIGTLLTGNHTAQSGDNYMGATALAAIIDQYDGTGLSGDTYPANQSQLSGLANVGSAVHRPAASYVLTTGTQSANLFSDTEALDNVRHEHTDAAGVIDFYYEFVIGSGTPSSTKVTGYVTGSNDDVDIHGYDWVAASWVQIGNIQGSSSTANQVNSFDLFVNMVGTGANKGKVRVRIYKASGLSSATVAIDQIIVAYNQGADGYDLGMIWYDDTASNTNTVVGVDGTSTNPVSTESAVNTLIASTGLNRVNVAPGSAMTLEANMDNCFMTGKNWILALAGFSISAAFIENAAVSGIGTGASSPFFRECSVGNVTLPPTSFDRCGFTGTMTVGSAGDFYVVDAFSQVAGSGSWSWDMGAAIGATNVSTRRHGGGWTIINIGTGDVISAEATAGGTLTVNGTGGDVEARGMWKQVTDSSGGSVTIVDKSITSENISDAVWDEILTGATHNISGSAGRRLRNIASTILRDDTAQGAGTGNNQIQLDTGASAVDGNYDPALVVLVGGTGMGQARLILEYDGATKTATVDRNWKVNPDATSDFIIIADAGREHVNEGLVQAATSTTVTLNPLASSSDGAYKGQTIFIRSGIGDDQARLITGYVGATKVATVQRAWDTNPNTTSAYVMLATALRTDQQVAEAVWDNLRAGHTDAGTFGEGFSFVLEDTSTTLPALIDDLAIKKNTAGLLHIEMVLTSDHVTPATGLTVTAQRLIDSGTYAAVSGTMTEISNGTYRFDYLAADCNGDTITWRFSEATADDTKLTFKTVA